MGLGNSLQTAQASGGGASVGGWVELGRTTLGSVGGTVNVASLPDKRYYMVLGNMQKNGSIDLSSDLRINNDTGSNYSRRSSTNGGAESSQTNVGNITLTGGTGGIDEPNLGVHYVANLSDEEKLIQGNIVFSDTTGATTPPYRGENTAKWANTSTSVTDISYTTGDAGFGTGSEVVVLGWDPADTHTTNFWEELASVELGGTASEISSGTITAKKYLWLQVYIIASGSVNDKIRFNNDTGSNYAFRYSANGGGDATGAAQDNINPSFNTSATNKFMNFFIINNSANEKLLTGNVLNDGGAGAGADPDRVEAVGKWANTSAQITEIDVYEDGGGSFDTGTIMKVWGSN